MKEGDCCWRLYYTGYDGTPDGVRRLGLATSADGLRWVRHPAGPLTGPGEWVEDGTVLLRGDGWHLFAEGRGDEAHRFVSADGLRWTRVGPLDVRHADGSPLPDGPLGTPAVYVEPGPDGADRWHLFYERRDAGVWHAISTDLAVWTNVTDDPVLTPTPGTADGRLIAMNQVVPWRGRYYAVYHGTGDDAKPRRWASFLAVSDDLNRWEKLGRPLRPVGENKSSGQLVHDGTGFRLYTMHGRVAVHFARPGPPPGLLPPGSPPAVTPPVLATRPPVRTAAAP